MLKAERQDSAKPAKTVLFGGTFDPIHQGHIKPVIQACNEIGAESLIFIPCHIPPHKQSPKVTSEDRFNMVQLVANDLNQQLSLSVSCSDYELKQQGKSFTRKTVEYFQQQLPNNELYFLIGMDSYLNFTSWYKWQEIVQFCQLLVVNRPGYLPTELPDLLTQRSQIIDVEQVDISSTQIRNSSETLLESELITPSVQHYIKQNKLYC